MPGSRWIPIRPGTDGALALGLAHVLIREDLHDEAFVSEWAHGYEEFADYVHEFTPERVSRITGIPGEQIEELARDIADAEGATYVMYTGLEYTKSGVQSIRSVMVLSGPGRPTGCGGRSLFHQAGKFSSPVNPWSD